MPTGRTSVHLISDPNATEVIAAVQPLSPNRENCVAIPIDNSPHARPGGSVVPGTDATLRRSLCRRAENGVRQLLLFGQLRSMVRVPGLGPGEVIALIASGVMVMVRPLMALIVQLDSGMFDGMLN